VEQKIYKKTTVTNGKQRNSKGSAVEALFKLKKIYNHFVPESNISSMLMGFLKSHHVPGKKLPRFTWNALFNHTKHTTHSISGHNCQWYLDETFQLFSTLVFLRLRFAPFWFV
jgi:hypothetical protein